MYSFHMYFVFLLALIVGLITIIFVDDNKRYKIVKIVIKVLIGVGYLFLIMCRYNLTYFYQSTSICEDTIIYAKYTLPISNISPLSYFLLFISLFIPKKIMKPFYCFLIYISIAMGLTSLISVIDPLIRNVTLGVSDVFDTSCHVLVMLYGIILFKNKEIKVDRKSFISSLVFIYSIILLVIALNAIFKTDFFGLTFYGTPNIYRNVLTSSPLLNIFIYCGALFAILLSTYLFYKIVDKKITIKNN